MVNMYTAHKPDKRFLLILQCLFRKCYPLQILFDFKNLSMNFWDKPRTLSSLIVNGLRKTGFDVDVILGLDYFYFHT